MLKVRDNLLINEAQIVTAVFDPNNIILTLTFTTPVSLAPDKEKPNLVRLYDIEAKQIWDTLSKGSLQNASSARTS